METQMCNNCYFFRGRECRLLPPVILVVGDSVRTAFPEPAGSDWCDEWNPNAQYCADNMIEEQPEEMVEHLGAGT